MLHNITWKQRMAKLQNNSKLKRGKNMKSQPEMFHTPCLNPPNARLCGKQKQKKQMIITIGKREGRHQQGLRFL